MSLRRLCAVKRAGAVAPAGAFPHELLEEAEARWKASVRAPTHASQLQVGPGVSLLVLQELSWCPGPATRQSTGFVSGFSCCTAAMVSSNGDQAERRHLTKPPQ
jgi:hypothetical protein